MPFLHFLLSEMTLAIKYKLLQIWDIENIFCQSDWAIFNPKPAKQPSNTSQFGNLWPTFQFHLHCQLISLATWAMA